MTERPELEILRRSAHLTLDAEGELLHEGEPILHPGLHKLFQAGLATHASGAAIVRVGEQWAYLQSPGSPFVVQRLRLVGEDAELTLNTLETVQIPITRLQPHLHGEHDLTLNLGDRVLRFGRRAWHALADGLELDGDERLWLRLGRHRLAVQRS